MLPGSRTDTIGHVTEASDTAPIRVCVYSDDLHTREKVVLALGKRPHPDLPAFEYVECATEPVVIATMDRGDIDLAILDGEAVPAWSRADAAVPHPIDAADLAEAVIGLVAQRRHRALTRR